MGAGRKTETIQCSDWPLRTPGGNSHASARSLSKADLAGVIFGCTHSTMAECLSKQLFGLPSPHISYVRNIKAGMPLFLFNYSDRKMHGTFEAVTNGDLNIDPYAWTDDGKEKTSFSAQVRIRIVMQCQPLTEKEFKKIIQENYYKSQHFWFELDRVQTNGLLAQFRPLSTNNARLPSNVARRAILFTPPSTNTTWNTIANSGSTFSGAEESERDPNEFINLESVNQFPSLNSGIGDTEHGGLRGTSIDTQNEEEYRGLSYSNCGGCRESSVLLEQQFGDGELETEGLGNSINKQKFSSETENSMVLPVVRIDNNTIPNMPEEVHEESMITAEPSILVKEKNTILHGSEEVVEIIKELKERTTALEKRQQEVNLEMQELRNVVKDSGRKIQQLAGCVKGLESKLMQSLDSGNAIYLIGGFNGQSWLSSLDSFSPSMDVLIPLKSMNHTRSYAAAAALNDNFYVFGGGDGCSWFNTVECYNQRSDDWTLCSPLIRPKGSLAGVTLNGKIFAIGGGNGSESYSDVEVFDPAHTGWVYYQSMLQKRFAPAAAELHGVLYAVGGYDGQNYLRSAEKLDPRVGYWTSLPDMKTRRGSHSVAVFNEKVYAIGGYDGESMASSVEIFDPRLGSWMACDPLKLARGYAASVVLGDSLFAIGGIDESNNIVEKVECYKEGTGWATCNYKAIGKRCFVSAIVL